MSGWRGRGGRSGGGGFGDFAGADAAGLQRLHDELVGPARGGRGTGSGVRWRMSRERRPARSPQVRMVSLLEGGTQLFGTRMGSYALNGAGRRGDLIGGGHAVLGGATSTGSSCGANDGRHLRVKKNQFCRASSAWRLLSQHRVRAAAPAQRGRAGAGGSTAWRGRGVRLYRLVTSVLDPEQLRRGNWPPCTTSAGDRDGLRRVEDVARGADGAAQQDAGVGRSSSACCWRTTPCAS